MTSQNPVFAKKTVSATIQASSATIASKTPKVAVAKKTTTTTKTAAPKKTIAKPVKRVVSAVKKPTPVTSTGRPQRAAATSFLNKLNLHRKQLSDYRAALAQYENGGVTKKPKMPDIPKEFMDALRSDETEDDSDESGDSFDEDEDDDDEDEDDDDDEED